MKPLLTLLVMIAVLFAAPIAVGQSIAVVYPNVSAPYDKVFQQIIAGIEAEHDGIITKYPVEKGSNLAEVVENIESDNPDTVITLGNTGYKLAKLLPKNIPLVSGALPIQPNGISGVSLIADPGESFTKLKQLAPTVKRIFVVHHQSNQWLMEIASVQASLLDIELIAKPASDLKQAITILENTFKLPLSSSDAIWIPLDRVAADDKVIFPMLLEASWDKEVVLFSNKPNHAKRGALFSLMPNHEKLGHQLVRRLLQLYRDKSLVGVEPLKDMDIAVNLRTASHLGINYTTEQKDTFQISFPSPK